MENRKATAVPATSTAGMLRRIADDISKAQAAKRAATIELELLEQSAVRALVDAGRADVLRLDYRALRCVTRNAD